MPLEKNILSFAVRTSGRRPEHQAQQGGASGAGQGQALGTCTVQGVDTTADCANPAEGRGRKQHAVTASRTVCPSLAWPASYAEPARPRHTTQRAAHPCSRRRRCTAAPRPPRCARHSRRRWSCLRCRWSCLRCCLGRWGLAGRAASRHATPPGVMQPSSSGPPVGMHPAAAAQAPPKGATRWNSRTVGCLRVPSGACVQGHAREFRTGHARSRACSAGAGGRRCQGLPRVRAL